MIIDERNEKSLLGALMQAENPTPYLLGLAEDDMVFEDDKIILAAMQRLMARREPFDQQIVITEAQKDTRYTNATLATVVQCMRETPSAAMIDGYYKRVLDASRRRTLQIIAQRLAENAQDAATDAEDAVSMAMDDLRRLAGGEDRWREMRVLAYETFDELERLSNGDVSYLPSGIPDLDKAIGGFFPGEMTILGARPAVGKSAFAAAIGANLASKGKKIAVCSLEMTPTQYLKRLLAAISGVDGRKLRTGKHIAADEWIRIGDAVTQLADWDMPFTFSVRTVEELEAEVMRRRDKVGVDMLIVDYMQLLRTRQKCESSFVQLTTVSHELKRMALELGIPILALAQVARPTIKGRPEMPTLDSLRGSGDLEMDADNVLFLHRPELPDDSSIVSHHSSLANACMREGPNQYIVCSVAKQRSGKTGLFDMIFDPAHMTYKCLAN